MMNVAIMGYGTIGSGVAEILEANKDAIRQAAGQELSLRYVLDLRDLSGSPVEDEQIHDFSIIEGDPEVDLVVETMGGLNPAYPFVKACLLAGKHVVTSNKALVAAHGTELLRIAREKQVNFFFEASVGGGIPIIRTLYRCLRGEQLEEIAGILNGTTNFILTKMDKEGWSFADALKEAQRLGYAEKDPTADVEGYDTCRKIAILLAMATGKETDYQKIHTEGITKITDTDFKYAARLGMSIKLVGSGKIGADGRVGAYVLPLLIEKADPLYTVSDVLNAVVVRGNMLGTTMYHGSGAGKLPTASAVVADLIEAAQESGRNVSLGWTGEEQQFKPFEEETFRYMVRLGGSLERRRKELEAMEAFPIQKWVLPDGADAGEGFAVLTGPMTEGDFARAAASLSDILAVVRGKA
ncbi:MAG: homoserine dehydrogenase [Lachnospiraceae bacterium]|nr:homoserine dehydrogenase [Lachnospiraceae bacterium]